MAWARARGHAQLRPRAHMYDAQVRHVLTHICALQQGGEGVGSERGGGRPIGGRRMLPASPVVCYHGAAEPYRRCWRTRRQPRRVVWLAVQTPTRDAVPPVRQSCRVVPARRDVCRRAPHGRERASRLEAGSQAGRYIQTWPPPGAITAVQPDARFRPRQRSHRDHRMWPSPPRVDSGREGLATLGAGQARALRQCSAVAVCVRSGQSWATTSEQQQQQQQQPSCSGSAIGRAEETAAHWSPGRARMHGGRRHSGRPERWLAWLPRRDRLLVGGLPLAISPAPGARLTHSPPGDSAERWRRWWWCVCGGRVSDVAGVLETK